MDSAKVAARPPARMIVIGSERFLDATATPRVTQYRLTSPSWHQRMKSDRRPGCACFPASASSSIFRQNAKRVAMNPALHPKSQSDLTVAPGSEIMRPVLLAVRGEGFSKHLVMGAPDGGRGPPVAPDGGRDRGGRLPAGRRRRGRQGLPREGPAARTRPRRGPRRRLALRSRVRACAAKPRDPRRGGEPYLRDGTAVPSPPGPASDRLRRIREEAGDSGEPAR